MDLRVEPSLAGGYVVRLDGQDPPVSRHDTEEEAEAWVARFGAAAAPPADAPAPRFVALPDGTQLVVRAPGPGEGPGELVAVDPRSGEIAGRVVDGQVGAEPGWDARGLGATLRPEG